MSGDEGDPIVPDKDKRVKQEVNPDYKPDHGSSFVPGAGPEHHAPKSLDHFKRGYEERAAQRDKEFYTVSAGASKSGQALEDQEAHAREPTPPPPPQPPNRRMYGRGGSTGNGNFGNNRSGGNGHGNNFDDDDNHYVANHDNYESGRFGSESYPSNSNGTSSARDGIRDHGSSANGTGFGGRGGRGGNGNRRYMDDPWGYRDRPTVLQGLDINALMDRLAELSHDGNPEKTLFAELDRVREEYKQIFETGKAMTALISVAARRKQIYLGHAVWDWMDIAKLHKNTFHYNSMISVAEKAKNYQHALDLLNQMTVRNIPKNEVTFSSAISACEKCGQWKIALDLLNSMEDEGVARTAIAYNAAISACEKGMVPQKACEVFQRMKRENIAPSVVSYSALISAAEKGSQWKLALEILEEMKQEGFHGNVVAYSAAISALAKGQQWRKALELFREIQSHGGTPSIVTYNATMTALEKGMQWERALDLFEEMKMRNLPITVVSYGSAISACDKGFQYRQCLEFLDEMTEMGIPKNVIIFGAAMSCMEKCSRADIGFQLMKRMKEEGIAPNVHIYNSAISACARCNLWEKGYELFQEMDKVNVRKDVVTYNAVLDAVASQIRLGRMLFEEGVQRGFYAKVSRLGEHWFELDLHFLSLGGGEIALGWWFEECLVPYLVNTEKLKNVKSISIVTGYGKTRTRGRRFGDDGMRKRCKAMLQFMNIQELPQPNAGRIHVDKESLIAEVTKNGGKVIFDLDGYIRWKENETAVNAAPDTPQMIRARFKPQVAGSNRPPFTRVENEHTSEEYRLENQKKRGFYVDDKPVASVFDEMDDVDVPDDIAGDEPRGSFRSNRGMRDDDDNQRSGGFRGGSGGRGHAGERRGFREGNGYGGGRDRQGGDPRNDGRNFQSNRSDFRDGDRSGRGYADNKHGYGDEQPPDRNFDDNRDQHSDKASVGRRTGGSGRGSWRGEANSNHYGPSDMKHEYRDHRRGGHPDGHRDRPSGMKDDRFETRTSRGHNPSKRFNVDGQEEYYGNAGERRHAAPFASAPNNFERDYVDSGIRSSDARTMERDTHTGHFPHTSDEGGNVYDGRSQRNFENEYSGGSRRADDDFSQKHPRDNYRQSNTYSNDTEHPGSSRSGYRTRQVEEQTASFAMESMPTRERDFEQTSNKPTFDQQVENDSKKRGYDEPERRVSANRGYALEPQTQKRRVL